MIRDIVFASKKSLGLAVRRFRELNFNPIPSVLFAFRGGGTNLVNTASVILGTGASLAQGGYYLLGTAPTVVNFTDPISASSDDCAMLAFRLQMMDANVLGGGMTIGSAIGILFADDSMIPMNINMFGKTAEINYSFDTTATITFVAVYEAASSTISLYVNGVLHASAPAINQPVEIVNALSMNLDDGTLTGYRAGYVQFVTFPGAASLPANIQDYVTKYHALGTSLPMAPL